MQILPVTAESRGESVPGFIFGTWGDPKWPKFISIPLGTLRQIYNSYNHWFNHWLLGMFYPITGVVSQFSPQFSITQVLVGSTSPRDGNPKETPKPARQSWLGCPIARFDMVWLHFWVSFLKNLNVTGIVGWFKHIFLDVHQTHQTIRISREMITTKLNKPTIFVLLKKDRCQIPFARCDYPRETSLKMFHQIKFHSILSIPTFLYRLRRCLERAKSHETS